MLTDRLRLEPEGVSYRVNGDRNIADKQIDCMGSYSRTQMHGFAMIQM